METDAHWGRAHVSDLLTSSYCGEIIVNSLKMPALVGDNKGNNDDDSMHDADNIEDDSNDDDNDDDADVISLQLLPLIE